MRLSDQMRVAGIGIRARRMRAALSALGIAIGTAAIVAVLGLSASSQAGLLAEIDQLGTNLLTANTGQSFTGGAAQLPVAAPQRISHLPDVEHVAHVGAIENTNVYRSPLIPVVNTNALKVRAASLNLPEVIGTSVAQGRWLDPATEREPVTVLGALAAQRLGIDRVYPGQRIWLKNQWFYVAGILRPATLSADIDTSALIGYPAAERYLSYATVDRGRTVTGPPTTVYVRTRTDKVESVQEVLARTANPESPSDVDVSQPSDALTARAAAKGAFNSLFLGLGLVALIVGAIGVANIMVISVLERRSEIGLRRALGATRGQIRTQFLSEAVMLAVLGGVAGVAAGALTTAIYANTKGWAVVVPVQAWAGGIAAAIVIGAIAGLLPALRAARLSPTDALRTL
ncbi:ABC transporter permease [Actinoallomurus bryophytorum]|uniref:Putative ABC transport system permease protein n=1 Tax=Actinoallomurus bryophytorum TaxID=1490222 RepID=A0A543CJ31_9ACTN|nr:ABC transporter permease [Actinoallomurus bryophytorum]TQL97096.1 putative ABC transport system permease protein [Actinoallomurus bryophytorum]